MIFFKTSCHAELVSASRYFKKDPETSSGRQRLFNYFKGI